MDFNNGLVAGAGGVIVGLIIGYSMASGGHDVGAEQLAKTEELSAKVETLTADVGGIGQRLGGVEGVVTALRSAQSDGLQGLSARVDGVGQQLTATVDGVSQQLSATVDQLGSGVSEAVKTQVEGLRGQLAGMLGAGAAAVAPSGAGQEAPATPAAPAATGTALTPGQTAVLTEGKLYVFLSSANANGGTAQVAVNGQKLVELAVGKPFELDSCSVSLTGFAADGAAMIDGGC